MQYHRERNEHTDVIIATIQNCLVRALMLTNVDQGVNNAQT
jgi:hypothetical protein